MRNIDKEFINYLKVVEIKNKNKIIPIQLDLNNNDQIKDAANKILKESNTIDILINNAGTIHTALFQMTSSKKLEEIFED